LIKVYIKDKYIELQDEGKNEIWYSQNSEEAKNIMYNAEKTFNTLLNINLLIIITLKNLHY